MKKLFIKLAKLLRYEIIDQNNFSSPTLNKKLNDDLSVLNQKSIVLPLGEVKISRKVNSLLLIVRVNTEIEIWDQNKKRLFEQPKIEYSIRSLNSLFKSISFCKKKYPNLEIKTVLVDDKSSETNLNRIRDLIKNQDVEIVQLNHEKFKSSIKAQNNEETFSNLASLKQSFEIGKDQSNDLIFFFRG